MIFFIESSGHSSERAERSFIINTSRQTFFDVVLNVLLIGRAIQIRPAALAYL